MANKDPEPTQTTDPPAEPSEEDKFWDKLDEKIKTGVGSAIEEKLTQLRESSNSRTGRKTLPGFIADFMWPPETSKK